LSIFILFILEALGIVNGSFLAQYDHTYGGAKASLTLVFCLVMTEGRELQMTIDNEIKQSLPGGCSDEDARGHCMVAMPMEGSLWQLHTPCNSCTLYLKQAPHQRFVYYCILHVHIHTGVTHRP